MQNYENFGSSIVKFFDDYSAKKDVQNESAKLDFKTFYEKHGKLAKVLPYVHYGLLSVFSIGTACFYLTDKVLSMLPVLAVAVGLALLMLGLWEYLKGYILSNLFEGWFYGVAHSGSGKVNIAAAVAGFALLGGSVFLSVSGAQVAALSLADKGTEIRLTGQTMSDSLNAVYAAKITHLEAAIDTVRKNAPVRWGGLLTASENKQILNLQNRIERVEAERAAALSSLSGKVETSANESLGKAENTAYVLIAISAINESLIVVCVWFGWFFAYKVRNEKQALASSAGGQDVGYIEHLLRVLNVGGVSMGGQLASGTLPIGGSGVGFQYGQRSGQGQDSGRTEADGRERTGTDNAQCSTVNVPTSDNKSCKHCKAGFTAKHWNAQYCSETCRITSWEARTGGKVRKGKK